MPAGVEDFQAPRQVPTSAGVPHHVDVEDALLSRAVVMYIWGDRGQPWPSHRPEAIGREFPDQAADLVVRLRDVIQSAQHVRPTDDVAEGGDLVVAAVRGRFPSSRRKRSRPSATSTPMPGADRADCPRPNSLPHSPTQRDH